MKAQTPVSMRLTGHEQPFRLTPTAQRELLNYLADARQEMAGDPDGDETVRDVEVAIGDKLSALHTEPVDAEQMLSTLKQVGPVVSEPASPGTKSVDANAPTWCRVHEGKWLAGVCLGVSTATEASVAWVRTIVVGATLVVGAFLYVILLSPFLTLVLFGLSVALYLALSVLLPPVASVSDCHRRSPQRKTLRA